MLNFIKYALDLVGIVLILVIAYYLKDNYNLHIIIVCLGIGLLVGLWSKITEKIFNILSDKYNREN